jgi:hypothetical protein
MRSNILVKTKSIQFIFLYLGTGTKCHISINPLKSNIFKTIPFSLHRKQCPLLYQVINGVEKNNSCWFWETHETQTPFATDWHRISRYTQRPVCFNWFHRSTFWAWLRTTAYLRTPNTRLFTPPPPPHKVTYWNTTCVLATWDPATCPQTTRNTQHSPPEGKSFSTGQRIPRLYAAHKSLTMFTRPRPWPVPSATLIQSPSPHDVITIHFNIILPSISHVVFSLHVFDLKLYTIFNAHACNMSRPSNSP